MSFCLLTLLEIQNDILGFDELEFFDGYCRYSLNYKYDLRNHTSQSTRNTLSKCYEKCKTETTCVAFAYAPNETANCNLYANGPYTYGNRKPNTRCYIMPLGKMILRYKYE